MSEPVYFCVRCRKHHRISVFSDEKGTHYICGWSGKELKPEEVLSIRRIE